MSDKYLFGYEVFKSGIRLQTLVDAIRNGSIRPYAEPGKPIAAPSISKKVRKFTSEEISVAAMAENVRRRKEGIAQLDPGSPGYAEFLADECWHKGRDFSWEYLSENDEQRVLEWLFPRGEVDLLLSDSPKDHGGLMKAARPNVKKRWDVLAKVKRENPNMTAKQLREHEFVIAAFGGLPSTEDRIRRKLKEEYGLSFS